MNEKNLRNKMSDELLDEDLLEQDQEATLRYRGVRGSSEKETRGSRGPVPLTGGGNAGNAGAGVGNPGAQAGAQGTSNAGLGAPPSPMPTAVETAAAGSVGVMAAGGDVRFDDEQLAASGIDNAEDPWGAYDNPENIPGMSLDEDDAYRESEWTAMALRGSGTRGGSKGRRGGMGPMMPMGGAGAGAGAGAGGAAAGSTPAGGGAPGGMMLPNATVGGIGGAQSLAAHQVAAYQNATGGAASAATLAGLNGTRATGAMFSPSSSGVLAAGGDYQNVDAMEFSEAIREAGMDTDAQYIEGPDGNLYPNPFYNNSISGSGRIGVPVAPVSGGLRGADLNGDGWVSEHELARWNAGQGRANPGFTQPDPVYSSNQPGVAVPHNNLPSGYTSNSGVRQGVEGLNRDALRGSAHHGTGSQLTTESSSGVNQQVSGLNSDQYSQMAHHSSRASVSKHDFVQSASGPTGSKRGYGDASAKDFSVHSEELRAESKEWDEVAEAQSELLPKYADLGVHNFGAMRMMQPAYDGMRDDSIVSTRHRTGKNKYTSENLDLTADTYDDIETKNAAMSDREIP